MLQVEGFCPQRVPDQHGRELGLSEELGQLGL